MMWWRNESYSLTDVCKEITASVLLLQVRAAKDSCAESTLEAMKIQYYCPSREQSSNSVNTFSKSHNIPPTGGQRCVRGGKLQNPEDRMIAGPRRSLGPCRSLQVVLVVP